MATSTCGDQYLWRPVLVGNSTCGDQYLWRPVLVLLAVSSEPNGLLYLLPGRVVAVLVRDATNRDEEDGVS